MAPTLTASYFVKTSTQSAAALSTPSFTPSNGEVVVVKMETWDTGTSMGSVTGGGQSYTPRVTVAPGGFRPWVGITTAVISGSPGSMTVSATPSASARCSIVVERWSGAQLAATPAVGSGNGGSGAANGSLTTAAASSVVSWVSGDAQSLDPATRAYLSSATDEGVRDDHLGSNGVGYHAWQSAASAGSQTFGLSAPTGMQWCIAGIEVQAAAGGSTVNGTASISGAGAVAATVTQNGAAALAGLGVVSAKVVESATAALTSAGAVAAVGSSSGGTGAALTGVGALTARATLLAGSSAAGAGVVTALATQNGKAAIAGAGSVSAAGVIAGAATLTGAGAATASVRQLAGASLTGAGALTAGAGGLVTGAAVLVGVGVVDINLNPCVTPRPNTGTTLYATATTARPDTGTTQDPC